MTTVKVSKESKLKSFMKAPIRILRKARDFYLKGFQEYSEQVNFGAVMGCPTDQFNPTLDRYGTSSTKSSYRSSSTKSSYRTSSTKSSNSSVDYRGLPRISSTKGLSGRMELDRIRRREIETSAVIAAYNIRRSQSVATIGRIDEEETCDLDDELNGKNDVVPSSRSYTVVTKGSQVRRFK